MHELRQFAREVGGPMAIAEMIVLVAVVMISLFYAGLAIGDI